ncbi:hypothetical protein BDZ89DRAFT_1038494 [Hymenopellis radicata]|nr:hypothetical protein BDZ89DRAFT_1038494 [Hymenopellis radicata]
MTSHLSSDLKKPLILAVCASMSFLAVFKTHKLKRHVHDCQEELEAMRSDAKRKDALISQLRAASVASNAEIQSLKELSASRLKESNRLERALSDCEAEWKKTRFELGSTRGQLQHHQTLLHAATVDLEEEQRAAKEVQSLLAERTGELTTAQAFLTTSDGVSGADVKDLVERLNADIFQTAAAISEFLEVKPEVVEHCDERAKDALTRYVGVALTELLQAPHSEFEFLVQIAIQTTLCRTAEYTSSSWTKAVESIEEASVVGMYDYVQKFEDPSVAGKWRSITRKCLSNVQDRDTWHQHSFNQMARALYEVLECLGVGTERAGKTVERFSDSIWTLAKKAMRLNTFIGEEVISSDLFIVCPRPGSPCREELLENQGDPGSFICTTDLGIAQVLREADGIAGRKVPVLKAQALWDSGLGDETSA